MRRALAVLALTLAAAATRAQAQPLPHEPATARELGRAGATLVSDDGVGALRGNPASLARLGGVRVEVTLRMRDADASYRSADADATASPTIDDRAPPPVAASAFGAIAVGPAVVALGYQDAALERALPAPAGQPPADVRRLFPHRYGGTASRLAVRTLMAGGALRPTDWLGVGAAVHLSDVEVVEDRTLWAGFAGRDPVGDPARDLALDLRARDRLVLGGALGVLVAPLALPLELALAVRAGRAVRADGDAHLAAAHGGDFPRVAEADATAAVVLRAPVVLAAGLRYLGERVTLEAGVEHAHLAAAAGDPRWDLGGLAIEDQSGQPASLIAAPSLLAAASHTTVRAAADVELAAGWMWLTLGYAHAGGVTPWRRLAPAAGDLGGHTAAAGLEASWDDVTIAVAYARRFASARRVDADDSEVALVDPFGADAAGGQAAAPGRFDAGSDTVALDVRLAWP